MGNIVKPNTFTNNTTASATEVNANFDTIYNEFNGDIDSNNLADDAVTTAKIANSNVTTAKIADSNVTTAKINDAAVTTAKINTNAVTDAKLIYGKVRSRQGGSSTNWGTAGTTNYDYSSTDTFVQIGSITGNTDGADKPVTFPTAFNQVPSVFVLSQTANSANVTGLAVNNVSTTGFNIRNVGANATTETIAWIAYGQ